METSSYQTLLYNPSFSDHLSVLSLLLTCTAGPCPGWRQSRGRCCVWCGWGCWQPPCWRRTPWRLCWGQWPLWRPSSSWPGSSGDPGQTLTCADTGPHPLSLSWNKRTVEVIVSIRETLFIYSINLRSYVTIKGLSALSNSRILWTNNQNLCWAFLKFLFMVKLMITLYVIVLYPLFI